jgi:magnesium chelatase family protein
MPLARIHTRARWGMTAPLVTVEVHLSNGLPAFNLVGLPDTAVRESRERVRSAILSSGFEFPQRRITVNLAPAELPKDGGRYDLAIAIGILVASGQTGGQHPQDSEFLAELSLSGELRAASGALPAALEAAAAGRVLFTAPAVADEAALAGHAQILAPATLTELIAHLEGHCRLDRHVTRPVPRSPHAHPDIADVRGQAQAKRALEIAASGGHHLLMIGPPGAGKSMLAQRLPGLLPDLTAQEALEVASLRSLDTYTARDASVSLQERPWRAPHHTATAAAMAGGGLIPRPGEISLSHCGVLFLDELAEFRREALEILREPLETGEISLSRARQRVRFPARVQLVAAMNPCPCGRPDKPPDGCSHPLQCCKRYQARISGPLMERMDMLLHVDAVPFEALHGHRSAGHRSAGHRDAGHRSAGHQDVGQSSNARPPTPESSAAIRERVIRTRERQLKRAGKPNSNLTSADVERHCALGSDELKLLRQAGERLGLSARASHRVLKVARTIADMAGHERIERASLAEALTYRTTRLDET